MIYIYIGSNRDVISQYSSYSRFSPSQDIQRGQLREGIDYPNDRFAHFFIHPTWFIKVSIYINIYIDIFRNPLSDLVYSDLVSFGTLHLRIRIHASLLQLAGTVVSFIQAKERFLDVLETSRYIYQSPS